ncbi:MAG TPA: hypothetical protein DHD79_07215 [Firmicutes bacterium]|jgi:hypothetical protein|nr:hypothetical protein [Bacillota bacterium]HAW69749.1 hypothetical protein [Bacillota bacterium]HAZ23253.1 hypothetical protein [Bacillota bacterium]HBE05782.1 hypothetical protein [Bacillota bacterium]HBG44215.1 hypothetical protein [Bacillota bacterium]
MHITKSMLVIRDQALKKKREKWRWGWAMVACISIGALSLWVAIEQMFGAVAAIESALTPFYGPALAVGITASSAGLIVATWYKKAKDEYDRLRLWMMARVGARVCECAGSGCNCREEFLKECKEKYDLNLYYYK